MQKTHVIQNGRPMVPIPYPETAAIMAIVLLAYANAAMRLLGS